jgi:hypothetical protein
MLILLLLGLFGIAPWQTASVDMPGTWVADHRGTTFVRLELKAVNDTIAGALGTGNVSVDDNGELKEVTAVPTTLTPLYEVIVKGPSITFMRPEGGDDEHFRFTVLGVDQAELTFILPEELLAELKDEGIPAPKPFRLHKIR